MAGYIVNQRPGPDMRPNSLAGHRWDGFDSEMAFVSAVLRTVGGIVNLIDRRVDERLERLRLLVDGIRTGGVAKFVVTLRHSIERVLEARTHR